MPTAIWPPELLPHTLVREPEAPPLTTRTGIVGSVSYIERDVPRRFRPEDDPDGHYPPGLCYIETTPRWNAWRFTGFIGGPNPPDDPISYLGAFYFHGLSSDAFYQSGDYLSLSQFGTVCTSGSGANVSHHGFLGDYWWADVVPNAPLPLYFHNGPESPPRGTFFPGEVFEMLSQFQDPTPVP